MRSSDEVAEYEMLLVCEAETGRGYLCMVLDCRRWLDQCENVHPDYGKDFLRF